LKIVGNLFPAAEEAFSRFARLARLFMPVSPLARELPNLPVVNEMPAVTIVREKAMVLGSADHLLRKVISLRPIDTLKRAGELARLGVERPRSLS
jgi:hypothetical protein